MALNNIVPMAQDRHETRNNRLLAAATALAEAMVAEAWDCIETLRNAETQAIESLRAYVPAERLLTTKEAAAYLRFTPRWLDERTRPGSIPSIPFILIGGEKRFRKESLDRWLDSEEIGQKRVNL